MTTREEAVRSKQAMIDERRRSREELARRAAFDRAEADLAREPRVKICRDAIYLNSAAIRRRVQMAETDAGRLAHALTWKTMGAGDSLASFGGWPFARADDVVEALNQGFGGLAGMGALEVVNVRTTADLEGGPGISLGFRPGRETAIGDAGDSLGRHFNNARTMLFSAWGRAAGEGDGLGGLAASAWAAIDGEPGKGPVTTLQEALPFQALVCWVGGVILAIRSLKYQAADQPPDPDMAGPVRLLIDPSAGLVLAVEQLPCAETWRPRWKDLPRLRLSIDLASRRVLEVAPAEEPPPVADEETQEPVAGMKEVEFPDDGAEEAGG
jgi:hypothetical protein